VLFCNRVQADRYLVICRVQRGAETGTESSYFCMHAGTYPAVFLLKLHLKAAQFQFVNCLLTKTCMRMSAFVPRSAYLTLTPLVSRLSIWQVVAAWCVDVYDLRSCVQMFLNRLSIQLPLHWSLSKKKPLGSNWSVSNTVEWSSIDLLHRRTGGSKPSVHAATCTGHKLRENFRWAKT